MKINYKTLLSMRFAKRLSLVMLTLTTLWFFQTRHADVGLRIADVGATPKSEIIIPTSNITNPTSTPPSVLRQKKSEETVILPQLFVKKKSTPEQKSRMVGGTRTLRLRYA